VILICRASLRLTALLVCEASGGGCSANSPWCTPISALILLVSGLRYCQRIVKPNFWGGEPEMMILSKMLQVAKFIALLLRVIQLSAADWGAASTFPPFCFCY
jgi:hypothetical protein